MNKTVLKWVGIAGVVGGAAALYLAGVNEATVTAVVGGVFILAGIILSVFKSA